MGTPYKVVLLGDSSVGKSSLALRFVKDQFNAWSPSTIGASFLSKSVNINQQMVDLDIWDTAGQERYQSLAPIYYQRAHAILIVFDLTNPESWDRAQWWIKEIQRNHRLVDNPIIYLVGNKSDLNHQITLQTTMPPHVFYVEVSAKTGVGVTNLFHELAQQLLKLTPQNSEPRVQLCEITEVSSQGSGYCCQ